MRCVAASLILLLAGGSAFAQDPAAQPVYPSAAEQAAPIPKHHPRRLARKRGGPAPLPRARPPQPPSKTETVAKAVPLPPSPPEPQASMPSAKQPAPLPIKLGGMNDWRVVTDPATGVVIGLPGRLLTQARDAAHGTLWSSPHGEIQIETFRYAEPGLTLATLFERMKREPRGRELENSALKDDNFVISGVQGLRNFSVRASARNGELRGFTLLYDQAMEGIVAPVRAAMASAFAPFPERAAPFAQPAKSVEYGSGVVISRRGYILTSARLAESCAVILATGIGPAERVALEDGLALLRVYGARKLAPVDLAPSPADPGALTLVGVPDPREQQGRDAPRDLAARLGGNAIELARPAPVAGFAGAAALDAQGRLAGLVEMSGAVLASNASPPLRLVEADAIRSFLSRQGVELEQAPRGDAHAGILRIICVRK